jgi:hypothetical protein
MASYPSIEFPNNIVPEVFNKNSFVSKALKSDDIITSSLNVLGPSTLNTLQSNTINNTSNLTSNNITSTGLVTCNNGLTVTGAILNYGTFAASNTVTCNNGLSVTAGSVSFPAASINIAALNGVSGRLGTCESNITKLQNYTSGNTLPSTISSNILAIDYSTFNNRPNLVTASANFSITVTNIPTTSVNAHYRIELFITNKFYCNSITVNGTVLLMTVVGGLSTIASQVNVNATGLTQTFIIFFTGTTTPSRVITEVLGTW